LELKQSNCKEKAQREETTQKTEAEFELKQSNCRESSKKETTQKGRDSNLKPDRVEF